MNQPDKAKPGPGILPSNLALLFVGVLDLASTLYWTGTGRAVEFNPVMAAVLGFGVPAFICVKLLSLGAYVAVVEWYRRFRSAARAAAVGRFTLAAYVCLYAASFALANRSFLPLG